MKKFFAGFLLVVFMLVSSLAFAGGGSAVATTSATATASGGGGGGGGGMGGPVIQESQELSKYEIYLLEEKVKKQISRMDFDLYREDSQDWWRADYDLSVDVIGGDYSAEWELKAGRYAAYTYGYRGWEYVMHQEDTLEVVRGGITSFNPILRLNDMLRFRISIPGVPGNYEPGACYQTIVKYSDGTQYSDHCGARLDGKGDVSLDQNLPTKKVNPEVYITDGSGNIHAFKANFNLLDVIDGTDVVIPYTPLSDTGILQVKVGYEMESKGLLVDPNPNFADGTADNPTGIRGQTNIKLADYLIYNVTDKALRIFPITVHLGNFGDYFFNLRVYLNGYPYGMVVATPVNNSSYGFYGGGVIVAGQAMELEIYADSYFSTGQIDPVRVNVSALDPQSWVYYRDKNIEGQAIYIAAGGNISISNNFIQSATFLKGSSWNNTLSLDIAALDEGICITEMELQRSGLSNEWDIALVRFVSGDEPWGVSTVLVSDVAKFGAPYRWCIPQDSVRRLNIFTDISPDAESGHQFYLTLVKVEAFGIISGKIVEKVFPDISISSEIFSIR